MSNGRFAGKRVLITGSGGYFGRELARAFADEGATLTLIDRVAASASQLADLGAGTQSILLDLSQAEQVTPAIEALHDDDLPDILINNAAIFPFADILDVDVDLVRKIHDVNVVAPLMLTQALARRWMARGQAGVVVNVTSAAAEVARTNGATYGPSKAALEQLTRILAIRLGEAGIRVNAVRPGIADDPENPHIPAAHLASVSKAVPLQRSIAPGELARAVMFLSGPDASFTTGHVLAVDGGGGLNRRAALAAS